MWSISNSDQVTSLLKSLPGLLNTRREKAKVPILAWKAVHSLTAVWRSGALASSPSSHPPSLLPSHTRISLFFEFTRHSPASRLCFCCSLCLENCFPKCLHDSLSEFLEVSVPRQPCWSFVVLLLAAVFPSVISYWEWTPHGLCFPDFLVWCL